MGTFCHNFYNRRSTLRLRALSDSIFSDRTSLPRSHVALALSACHSQETVVPPGFSDPRNHGFFSGSTLSFCPGRAVLVLFEHFFQSRFQTTLPLLCIRAC